MKTCSNGVATVPLWSILPGLLFIIVIDVLAVAGPYPGGQAVQGLVSAVMLALPWATLLVLRTSPSAFGYARHRALAQFGWGVLAGAVWRGLSIAFNLRYTGMLGGESMASLLMALVGVPLMEETYYRGYLMRPLAGAIGKWPAIALQAVLFSLFPYHWSQGWPALLSIFCFGLLAGWLAFPKRTIWAAWGAHGFANILPDVLRALAAVR